MDGVDRLAADISQEGRGEQARVGLTHTSHRNRPAFAYQHYGILAGERIGLTPGL
jgi:hypothetical protein